MFDLLKDFFIEHQPTEADAYRKAGQLGWRIERTETGYTVYGTGYDQHEKEVPSTYQFPFNQVDTMNYLFDHVLSVRIGEEYRLRVYGPEEPESTDEASRRRHEIRDYRIAVYHAAEYKPGWKRLVERCCNVFA